MKIDVSGIENYAEMTAEEKVAALEGFEYEDYKASFDKASHDLAESKKQLKAFQDQQSKGADKTKTLEDQVAELTKQLARRDTISELTAQYVSLGYDAELAKATAEAYADGDTATVFANQKAFNDAQEKAIKAELLKQTPRPGKGGTGEPGGTGMTKEKFKKLSFAERAAFASAHPDEYSKFYGG